MNWTNPRDVLIPNCKNYGDFGFADNKFNKQVRGQLLEQHKNTCRYCGGTYAKYLICTYIPNSKVNDLCCRLCHMITHINTVLFGQIELYYSETSQIDIVKKTIEYVIKNNVIPQPFQIDNNIKLTPISLLEFVNILNNYDTFPQELKNYKLFFTDNLSIDFIISNFGDNQFINDIVIEKPIIGNHIAIQNELDLFKKHFG